jgi:Protein of unknown function (DUF3108)
MLTRIPPLVTLAVALPLLTLSAMLASPAWAQSTATVSAEPQSVIQPPDAGYHPPAGTLKYDAEWRVWKAGSATIRVSPAGGGLQHVVATAESSGAVAVLYRVEDRIESYFHEQTNCSDRILKHSEEGFHKRETSLLFDPLHGKSILDERNLRSGETKHQVTDSPACVTDVLSGIFYLAGQHLEPGTVHAFPLNDGGKTVRVTAAVEAREEVRTDAGTFPTIRVAIYSNTGPLKGRGRVWIWYTDDANHLPVQMRSRLFWGTMTLRLTGIDK